MLPYATIILRPHNNSNNFQKRTTMDNITKEQAVEIIKEAFELDSFQERKEGKSFYGEDSEDVSFFFDKR